MGGYTGVNSVRSSASLFAVVLTAVNRSSGWCDLLSALAVLPPQVKAVLRLHETPAPCPAVQTWPHMCDVCVHRPPAGRCVTARRPDAICRPQLENLVIQPDKGALRCHARETALCPLVKNKLGQTSLKKQTSWGAAMGETWRRRLRWREAGLCVPSVWSRFLN